MSAGKGQATRPRSARRELWRAVGLFRREFVLVALLSAVSNLLMLTPTLYMLQVYDRVMVSGSELTLVAVSGAALAMFAVMAVSEWLRSRLLVGAGVRLDEHLGTRVFDASFRQRLGQGPGMPSSGRAFGDLLLVRQFLTGPGLLAFFDLPWVPVYVAVMFLLHPMLGWLSLAFAVVQALLAWLGHQRTLRPAESTQQAAADLQQDLQAKLRNLEAVDAMGMVGALRARWARAHAEWLRRASLAQGVVHQVAAASKFVRYSQQSLSLGAGALLVIQGQLTPGAMIAANVLMMRTLAPIDGLVSTWRVFITAREAFRRLGDLLERNPEPAADAPAPAVRGALELRRVSATVPGRPAPILRHVDLQLSPGQVLVVMGPSGSGKSTLLRVMLGIWSHVEGEVLLDGTPVTGRDRTLLGPSLGYLPQDVELFDGTIAANIARLGAVDSGRVIAAARAVGLHDIILRYPRGYDTPVGEGGRLLPGGLRQRIGLARAAYGDPALVLLDEPGANLDDAGELALARAVGQMRERGAAVVLVSHRPSALALADAVLRLRDGAVESFAPRDAAPAAEVPSLPAPAA